MMKLTETMQRRLREALEEDLGSGDLTTECTLEPDQRARATLIAKQNGIVCGLEVATAVVGMASKEALVENNLLDGDPIEPGRVVSTWEGPAAGLMSAERLALNLIGHLSGVATLTRRFVQAAGRSDVCIRDTRKTTPLWRELEKYAVRVGGGTSHRFGLYDMILIKENHIHLAGSIETAVQHAVTRRPEGVDVGVECRTLDDVHAAMHFPVDFILLDNMDLETMRTAVGLCAGQVRTEASGNVSLDRIASIAGTGVTDISIGALTHSAPVVDFSIIMERPPEEAETP